MDARLATKLQDCVAHAGGANCLRIGAKSGRIVVTGGDDKRVSLWTVGSTQPIVSLSGHTSPVESVALDHDEEIAVAGSSHGIIRLWDLEQAKVVRTLAGHKGAVRAVEFHPYGEFFASGSADASLRVWDIRKRSCIQTYRGHAGAVTVAKFSPDGRWLLSGSDDGLVKLWDLTAGKLLHSFPQVAGAIGGLHFHPHEFMLAFSAADGVTRFWDLENFSLISATPQEDSPIQSILFDQGSPKNPDAGCRALLSISQSAIRTYQWEPMAIFDSQPLAIPGIRDAILVPNTEQVMVGSVDREFVALWSISLARLRPFAADDAQSDIPVAGGSRAPEKGRPEGAPRPSQPMSNRKTFDRGDPSFALAANVDAGNVEAEVLQKAFQELSVKDKYTRVSEQQNRMPNNFPGDLAGYDRNIQSPGRRARKKSIGVADDDAPASGRQEASANRESAGSGSKEKKRHIGKDPGPALKSSPSFDFLKCTLDMSGNEATKEHELLESLSSGHYSMIGIMSSRLSAYRSLRSAMAASGMRGVAATLANIGDSVVLLDTLNSALNTKLTLDTCNLLLPSVLELLRSPYEKYAERAVLHLKLLVRSFSAVILSTLDAERYPSQGIDISREERLEKCRGCYQSFMLSVPMLDKLLAQASPAMTAAVKDCLAELDALRVR